MVSSSGAVQGHAEAFVRRTVPLVLSGWSRPLRRPLPRLRRPLPRLLGRPLRRLSSPPLSRFLFSSLVFALFALSSLVFSRLGCPLRRPQHLRMAPHWATWRPRVFSRHFFLSLLFLVRAAAAAVARRRRRRPRALRHVKELPDTAPQLQLRSKQRWATIFSGDFGPEVDPRGRTMLGSRVRAPVARVSASEAPAEACVEDEDAPQRKLR